MAQFRFSRLAEADLLNISTYTLRTWGEAQTSRYLAQLEDFCRLLSGNPALGRASDEIRPGLRRAEHSQHVVFFRQEPNNILISRILDRRMLPGTQRMPDEQSADRDESRRGE